MKRQGILLQKGEFELSSFVTFAIIFIEIKAVVEGEKRNSEKEMGIASSDFFKSHNL